MSIIEEISSLTQRHPEVNQQQHADLVQSALQMFGNRGGISDLLQNAEGHGLGSLVQSWIGTGANQTVGADQLQSIVGQDRINQLASRVGVSPGVASAALTQILPVVVDRLTAHGRLPESSAA